MTNPQTTNLSQESRCAWTLSDPDFNVWHTSCGNDFNIEDSGPVDNKMKFCCYCGAPLEEKQPTKEFEDDEAA